MDYRRIGTWSKEPDSYHIMNFETSAVSDSPAEIVAYLSWWGFGKYNLY